MLSTIRLRGSASIQGPLWDRCAHDWAEIQEPQSRALYDIVLKALALNRDSSLLDIGCGSGLFCELANKTGASVMGLDASATMLDFARQRTPHSTFFAGEMEELPFVDATFDRVTILNTLQHATSPLHVLADARRILRPGGRIVLATWAQPDQCKIADFLRELDHLLPLDTPNTPAAFFFSTDGMLARLVARAGFAKLVEVQALTIWTYPDEETALRGLLSFSAAEQAITLAGEERVRETARQFLIPHRLPRGGYRLENTFRYLIAQRA